MIKNLYRLFICTILCGLVFVFSGCGGKLDDIKESNDFFEEVEKVNEVKTTFYDAVLAKITNEQQKTAFTADYYQVSMADTAAAIYFSAIQIYNLTPTNTQVDIKKENDTYIITDGNSVVKMTYDETSKSVRLESYDNNILDFFTESTKLSNGDYAYQLFTKNTDNNVVIQLVFNETSGKLSYNEVTSVPTSIYKKTSLDSKFAIEGIRVYKYENGNFTFTGDLGIDDPIDPTKVVSDFTISGLKTTYTLNEELNIDDINLNVKYTDNTNATIIASSSMVVGTMPSTSTLGAKTLVLKYQEIQKSFNFEVVEGTITNEQKLKNSFDNFYKTLYFDLQTSFIGTNITRQDILTKPEVLSFFSEFTTLVSDQWGHVNLLNESVLAIKAHSEGNLGTLVFPNPTGDTFGKSAYCTYNDATQTYNVGYWSSKELNRLYWFESEITFDSTADSLKATIKAGVDANQILRCKVEYTKISDGNYALMMYYPEDENDVAGKYSLTQARFTKTEGNITLNKWVEGNPTSIYKGTNLTNYASSGDRTLSINPTTVTYTDNLKCLALEFLNSFIYVKNENGLNVNLGSLEDTYLSHMTQLGAEFNDYEFKLYNTNFELMMDYLADYEMKQFDFSEFTTTNITKNNDTTTMVLTDTYGTVTYVFKYATNKLYLEYTSADEYEVYEIVKTNNIYYVQIVKQTVDEDNKTVYNIYQAKYVDNKNMTMTLDEYATTKPTSIYSSIPTNFVTNGDKLYSLVNDVYTYKHKYLIYFYPENEQDEFSMYTDLDGKLVLPNSTYTGYTFKGWSTSSGDLESVVGLGGKSVTFTEDTYLYAIYE